MLTCHGAIPQGCPCTGMDCLRAAAPQGNVLHCGVPLGHGVPPSPRPCPFPRVSLTLFQVHGLLHHPRSLLSPSRRRVLLSRCPPSSACSRAGHSPAGQNRSGPARGGLWGGVFPLSLTTPCSLGTQNAAV